MKRLLIVLAVCAVAGAGTWWYISQRPDRSGTQLTLYGNIEIRDVDLAFNESEHIAEVLVEEGNRVSRGDLLARLHTDRLDALLDQADAQLQAQEYVVKRLENGTRPEEIGQAQADVNAAETRLQNAETTLRRLRQTAASGATSEQALDDAEATVRTQRNVLQAKREALNLAVAGPRDETIAEARAALEGRQAQVRFLQARLKDTRLTAPAAGVVQNRIMEPGEMASPNLPVLTLALTTPKWVRAYVSEPNLGRIKKGMPATVSSDSYPDKPYEGQVGFISPVAEFTPKTVETTDLRPRLVYETRITVDDPDNELRLGMPVTVTIPVTPAPVRGRD